MIGLVYDTHQSAHSYLIKGVYDGLLSTTSSSVVTNDITGRLTNQSLTSIHTVEDVSSRHALARHTPAYTVDMT